ncbi:TadE/TadG family type IV pilus assembly protein [Arabiibacter massiliensis]|uniref:TadE/TadG family type IV pilus assembly protein n=1 Tax=Arabiibacter massiliensis TaxID=1870985 RepID=UPI001E61CA50|nr:TadE family protein [Arabiibacter massiliensis]
MLRPACGERGSSVVSFLLALPILLAFLFAVVDLGRSVFLGMALEDAAHAACRAVCSAGSGEAEQTAREAALAASPSLAAEGLRLAVAAHVGELEEEPYVHRLYDADEGAFEERPSRTARRTVRVDLELEGSYLTPAGALIAVAEGRGDGGFAYAASAAGERDETVEGGAW